MTISPVAGLIAALVVTLASIRAILTGTENGAGLVVLAAITAVGAALNAPSGGRNDTDKRS